MIIQHADLPVYSDTPEISSSMSTSQIISHLVKHGCLDITNELDLSGCTSYSVDYGGYSNIFRGVLHDRTVVAIKCPRVQTPSATGLGKPNKALKRMAREICSWSKLEHPNIAKLLGVAIYQGQISMVSPWVGPGNFYAYIAKHRDSANHFDLCVQVAKGLAYLHSQGVVYGDLKALNILIDSEGAARLTDFGLSILAESVLRFTMSQNYCEGTSRWMAPELIQEITPRSMEADIYAFGMTVVEILTEDVPFPHIGSPEQVMYRVVHNGLIPSRPTRLRTGDAHRRDEAWWLLLVRCWDREYRNRPTIKEILRVMAENDWNLAFDMMRSQQITQKSYLGLAGQGQIWNTGSAPQVFQAYSSTAAAGYEINSTSRCFGITVGVNCHGEMTTQKAVEDADRMDSYLRNYFSCDNLTSLRNRDATAIAIMNTLEQLKYRPDIRRSDRIIFYYAGSSVLRSWDCELVYVTGDILPLLEVTTTLSAGGIAESTLAKEFKELAVLKGCLVLVIIDSCRQGPQVKMFNGRDAMQDCVSDGIRLSNRQEKERLFQDSNPYVVLSACGEGEIIFEGSSGGLFTDALLKTLDQLDPVSTITYEGIVSMLSRTVSSQAEASGFPKQTPVCYGAMKRQTIFAPGRLPAFPVSYFDTKGGMWFLQAGTSSGVIPGSSWELFARAPKGSAPVGYAIANEPGQDTVQLEPRSRSLLQDRVRALQRHLSSAPVMYACPVEYSSSRPLHVYFENTFPQPMSGATAVCQCNSKSHTTRQAPYYIALSSPDDADIVVRFLPCTVNPSPVELTLAELRAGSGSEQEARFYLQYPQVVQINTNQPLMCGVASATEFNLVLTAAAWWDWHLKFVNTPTLLQTQVSLQFLKIGEVMGSNFLPCGDSPMPMTKCGVVEVYARERDRYGIRVMNDARVPLYAWAFYFSASDLSIIKLFGPKDIFCKIPGESSITIGTQFSGEERIGFGLGKEQELDIGFIKVFWSTEYLDLNDVAQISPSYKAFGAEPREAFLEKNARWLGEWGAITITVVQRS